MDEVGGEGGSLEEMKDVDEDEEEEEVVVLGDVGCAAMLAGAALRAAAASSAVTVGRMKCMSSGRSLGAGGLGGPGRELAARRVGLVGSGGQGRRGAAVSAFWARLGWAPAMREGVWVVVCGGEQFAWAAFGGWGGWAWGFGRVFGGRVRVTGRGECAVGRGAPRDRCVWVSGCGER